MSNESRALPDIRQTIVLKAPINKVWTAVSTAEGIAAWFMPSDFEPIVGREFHLEAGPWGKSKCKVTVIEPLHKLSFEWGKDWSITFELVEEGDTTIFTLIHSGWYEDQVTEFGQAHATVRERMNGGWVGIVKKLQETVEV